jgi:glycine/D-amino acid oxidase-like deaminating enzyme
MQDSHLVDQHILIVGGGTAGWMTAALMINAWGPRGVRVSLLESKAIGIIGVGEGSTPKLRRFFARLGISEADWMPRCNASYKCGIRFPHWSTRPGFESYYHPFFSHSDDGTIRAFFNNATMRSRNIDAPAHPDAFFVSNFLARHRRAPLPASTTGYEADYAYHFDAALIGEFLRDYAVARGVQHLEGTVQEVHRSENGDISSVTTPEQGAIGADFFVDCTGFAALLLGKALGVPFRPYKDILFNDRAVAMPTPLDADGTLPSETTSTALRFGWVWKIPLTNRYGNGYVYASDFVDADGAERELRAHLGLQDADIPARHLQMRVGRMDKCWQHNCLAVGLAQGFIEPLEATALMIVQDTVEAFVTRYEQGGFTPRYRADVNERISLIFDGVKNYIFTHYKLNTRSDTEYWIANRENSHVAPELERIYALWDQGGDLLNELRAQAQRHVYSPTSWYCILAGMGRFPSRPKKAQRGAQIVDPRAASAYCESLLPHFPDHRAALARQATPTP